MAYLKTDSVVQLTTDGGDFLITDPDNVPPVLTGDLSATVAQGGTYTITTTDLNFTDSDDTAAGVTFTTSSPVNGAVKVNGIVQATFTGTQLAASQVSFTHDGSATIVASFQVSVEDGNEDSSVPVAQTFNLTVIPTPPITTGATEDTSDGRPKKNKSRKGRFANADDELTEFEVQFMQRKLRELKQAKTEREKAAHAKTLEVALAQATKDDDAAEVISATIQKAGKSDYGAVMRDVSLLTEITDRLQGIVRQVEFMQDEDDVETLLMMVL